MRSASSSRARNEDADIARCPPRASRGTAGPADGPRVRRVRLSDARKRAPSRSSEKTVVTVEVLVFSRGPRRRDGTRVVARLEPPLGAAQPDRRLAAAMNTARSGKKTMASWVADLEQGTAARRPDDAGRFGATARASPAQTKTHPPRRPPPFHTDPAPQPAPPRLGGNKSPGSGRGAAPATPRTQPSRRVARSVRPARPPSRSAEPKRKETRASARFASIDEEDPVERAEHQSIGVGRASHGRARPPRCGTASARRWSRARWRSTTRRRRRSRMRPDPPRGRRVQPLRLYGAGARNRAAVSIGPARASGARRVARVAFGLRRAGDATATQAALFARGVPKTASRGSCSPPPATRRRPPRV